MREHRYTLHVSRESRQKICTVNLHHVLQNGEASPGTKYVKSVKGGMSFSPLFSAYTSILDGETYDVNKPSTTPHVDLGNYAENLVVVYTIFIGPPRFIFYARGEDYDFDVRQAHFKEFSILLMWSFLTSHPSQMSVGIHLINEKAEIEDDIYNLGGAVYAFQLLRIMMRRHFIEQVSENHAFTDIMPLVRHSTFVKYADPKHQQLRDWWRLMEALQIRRLSRSRA